MKIEVCINRLEDLELVQGLSVDRIELCIELNCGGLTPSLAMVEQAVHLSKIPIHVLVRPRSGDFIYTPRTLAMMLQTCRQIERLGVAGIVTGALAAKGRFSPEILIPFRKSLNHTVLYFHRAFDEIQNPDQALASLKNIGFNGLLSSGQQKTALEGIDQLVAWKKWAGKDFEILPGAGINAENCSIFKEKQFNWIHLSAKQEVLPLVPSKFSSPQYGLNLEALQQLIALVK
ncbi:MAG: copper homeostasis protein CutC [Flavobacteriaceae bacterium]